MKTKIVFGRWEASTLLINTFCTQIFLNFPRTMAEAAGTSAWILTIYISIVALLVFFLIAKLYEPFEGKDPLDIGEIVAGDIGRVITGLIFMTHITFILPLVLREFGEDMKVIGLTVSPISFVLLFFMAGMVISSYLGIEAIVRFHAIIVPIILAGLAIILLGITPFCDLGNLIPLLGNGLSAIFGKGFLRISSYSALIALFFIFPYIKTTRNFKIAGFTSISITGFFMCTTTLAYTAIQPYPTAVESFLPVYQMARLINYGRFFQRIEPVFALIWAASALLYLSLAFFLIIHIFSKTFKLEHHKPVIIPWALVIFTISLLPKNLMSAIDLETRFFRTTAWVIAFGFMSVLLLIARFRAGMKKKEGVQ